MYKKFTNFAEILINNKLTYVVIILIGFTVGFLLSYFELDSTPATIEDYAPLLEIQNDILDNFNNVYHYDNTDINLIEKNIVVSTYNDECSINIFFDQDLNYLYTEKKDNIDFSKTTTIIISVVAAISLSILFICAFFIILLILDLIIFTIDAKHK